MLGDGLQIRVFRFDSGRGLQHQFPHLNCGTTGPRPITGGDASVRCNQAHACCQSRRGIAHTPAELAASGGGRYSLGISGSAGLR